MPIWITLAQFVPLYLLLIWEHAKLPISLRERRARGKDRLPSGERDQAGKTLPGGSVEGSFLNCE
jgi:hypothetical protein